MISMASHQMWLWTQILKMRIYRRIYDAECENCSINVIRRSIPDENSYSDNFFQANLAELLAKQPSSYFLRRLIFKIYFFQKSSNDMQTT